MNILMLAPLPKDIKSVKGGVESATLNLLAGLKNQACSITVVSFNRDVESEKKVSYSSNINVIFYPVKHRSKLLSILLYEVNTIKQIIKNIKPDLIHIQGNGTRLLYMLAGIRKNIWVATPHGSMKLEKDHLKQMVKRVNHSFMIYSEKLLMKKVDAFIYISNYTRKYFIQEYNTKVDDEIIFNAVKPEFFDVNKQEVNINRLLFVGVINRRKGLLTLIKVLDKLKKETGLEFKLNVVGGYIDMDFKSIIDDYIETSSVKNNIEFLGWKSQTELLDIMAVNDIFILPSSVENLPISIAEAMAAGRVPISTNVGGIVEMIDDGNTGYIYDHMSEVELFEVLKNIHNKELGTLSLNCQNSAKMLFHPDSVASQTVKFYTKVLENGKKN